MYIFKTRRSELLQTGRTRLSQWQSTTPSQARCRILCRVGHPQLKKYFKCRKKNVVFLLTTMSVCRYTKYQKGRIMENDKNFNPKPYLIRASKTFGKRPASRTGRWNLSHCEGIFLLLPTTNIPRPEVILMSLSDRDLQEGLTSRQWNRLENKIVQLHNQGIIT